MNIDDKKAIFKVALADSTDSWRSREIYLVASGYDHAKKLAEEYVEYEIREEQNLLDLLDSDGSLNKKVEKKLQVKGIQEMFDKVVY